VPFDLAGRLRPQLLGTFLLNFTQGKVIAMNFFDDLHPCFVVRNIDLNLYLKSSLSPVDIDHDFFQILVHKELEYYPRWRQRI
jgi:hypothetical protein